jgi:hypothetical protein
MKLSKFKNPLNFQISAFSLIELIVGITISMILMISIWVFVSSGMQNIFLQQKSLQNTSNFNDFASSLYETIWSFDVNWSRQVNSGSIIFKRNAVYDNWWFAYIWITERDWFFCEFPQSEDDPEPEDTKTKHIFIKNFIPFVESWENISNTWEILESKTISFDWKNVKSLQKEHKIVDENWNTIVWRWVFWGELTELWTEATKVYLNSPTWLASSGEILYISDTLNNRVLYLSGDNVYTLLDENDWLLEPTGLYFEDNVLYIANSWSWEILKFSSPKVAEIPIFSFSWVAQDNVWEINITLLLDWKKKNLTNTGITLNFWQFDWNEVEIIDWIIDYKFIGITISTDEEWNQTKTNYPESVNFNLNETYTIEFNEANSFWEIWNYTVKLKLWASFEKEFYFFTQWDEKIYTKNDNTLEVFNTWLNYPNWVWWEWENDFNPFSALSINNLDFDEKNDIILKTPIESLEVSLKDWDLINIILKYYRNYNCYNSDENKEKIETFISKINLR